MIDDDDYGAVGGMRIDRGNRSTRRKPVPVPLCPPQIPYDLTCDRTGAAAVGLINSNSGVKSSLQPCITSEFNIPCSQTINCYSSCSTGRFKFHYLWVVTVE
jgi:hypothetical protein